MFALQFWVHQSRGSSFRVLFAALVLAVAAISSVGVFSARLDAALIRDATQMLGGDLVIERKSSPETAEWKSLLRKPEYQTIKTAESAVFPSVVPAKKTDLLVSVKAVNSTYPLRGQLLVRQANGQEVKVPKGPAKGKAWVDQSVVGSLDLAIGETISLGNHQLEIEKVILIEPDRGPSFINFAPRVMISLDDLDKTGLIGPGSRVRWNTYLSDESSVIDRFKRDVQEVLTPADEITTIEEDRPALSASLTRAKNVLAMAALVGTLVACVGIALVSHLFAKEQTRELAVLKSLGYSPKQLTRIWLVGLCALTIVSGFVGVALGWLGHWVLLALLADLIGVALPIAGFAFLPFGVFLAGLFLLGFAAVPAYFCLQAPASAVIRQQSLRSNRKVLLLSIFFGLAATVLISFLVVQNNTLAFLLCVGFAVVSVVFALVFWFLLKALAKIEQAFKTKNNHIAIFQSMSRRAHSLVIQGVSLSLGLSALLILAVVQGDLVQRWKNLLPQDTPNRFIFNIQPDQVNRVENLIASATDDPIELYPMVRGRLSAINNEAVAVDSFDNRRAQNLVQRELNVSFTQALPSNNKLEQGQWFDFNSTRPEVSMEAGAAKSLGLKIGDRLTFNFAGESVQAELVNTRSLRWDSMEVNFVVIFPPQVLQDFPQTWITAFYAQEPKVLEISRQLVREFPNVTVLDVGLVIVQLQNILTKVGQAVQFIFLFTLFSGGLVVMACVLSSARTRTRECAILRALGASSRQLIQAAWLELTFLGGLAGLVAAIVAQLLGWAVAHYVFEFEYVLSGYSVGVGLLLGIVVSVLFGAWSIRRVCLTPVMRTLRHTPI